MAAAPQWDDGTTLWDSGALYDMSPTDLNWDTAGLFYDINPDLSWDTGVRAWVEEPLSVANWVEQ